jgi:prepilin-type N-terminal cleavage/methylation domain-containing protein
MQFRQFQKGFSLVELMISLVIGLIVSGAAVALVAAIGKSNSDTVRATRLTQELRATAEVISRELRRARSVSDPIANVSKNTAGLVTACNTVDVSTAGCVTYGYDCGGSVATTGTDPSFNSIGLAGNKVYWKQSTAGVPACPTTADVKISSDAVKITKLTFVKNSADAYTIKLQGELAYRPSVINSVTITNPTRTISQEVRIRSAKVQ